MMLAYIFIASILGIVSLLSLRLIEERRGRRYFARSRAQADLAVIEGVGRVEQSIRSGVSKLSRQIVVGALKRLAMGTVSALHAIEERLISFVDLLRGRHFNRFTRSNSFRRESEE